MGPRNRDAQVRQERDVSRSSEGEGALNHEDVQVGDMNVQLEEREWWALSWGFW